MKKIIIPTITAYLFLNNISKESAYSQEMPDAGKVLQEYQPKELKLPKKDKDIEYQMPQPETKSDRDKSIKIKLTSLRFVGNTLFSNEELQHVAGDVIGKELTLEQIREIANRITRYYVEKGYVFSFAFLPEQKLSEGILTIQIVEGRYGKIIIQGYRASEAEKYFNLRSGDIIEGRKIERPILLLSDLPGVDATPVMRPGQEFGTGNLIVDVKKEKTYDIAIGGDNYGNRYVGRYKANVRLNINSPFMLGDQINILGQYSNGHTWFGLASYGFPIGYSGLRGVIEYNHSYYELGKEFSALDAYGTSDVIKGGLSYPIIRTKKANLYLGVNYQHKWLKDKQEAVGKRNNKRSDVVSLMAQFNSRDDLLGGGITFGGIVFTNGWLKLDDELEQIDKISHRDTRGSFAKYNFSLGRIQSLGFENLTLYANFNAQIAGKNLDSSEEIGLGGINGIRAYPTGEASGDEGYITQLELRYQYRFFMPYVFYDFGKIKYNAKPGRIVPAIEDNSRYLSGYGLGLRFSKWQFESDISVAWRHKGGKPISDSRDYNPMVWINVNYKF